MPCRTAQSRAPSPTRNPSLRKLLFEFCFKFIDKKLYLEEHVLVEANHFVAPAPTSLQQGWDFLFQVQLLKLFEPKLKKF